MIRRLYEHRYIRFTLGGHRYDMRCHHRSHRLRLPCWRYSIYDHLCARHNRSCFDVCPLEDGQ